MCVSLISGGCVVVCMCVSVSLPPFPPSLPPSLSLSLSLSLSVSLSFFVSLSLSLSPVFPLACLSRSLTYFCGSSLCACLCFFVALSVCLPLWRVCTPSSSAITEGETELLYYSKCKRTYLFLSVLRWKIERDHEWQMCLGGCTYIYYNSTTLILLSCA